MKLNNLLHNSGLAVQEKDVLRNSYPYKYVVLYKC